MEFPNVFCAKPPRSSYKSKLFPQTGSYELLHLSDEESQLSSRESWSSFSKNLGLVCVCVCLFWTTAFYATSQAGLFIYFEGCGEFQNMFVMRVIWCFKEKPFSCMRPGAPIKHSPGEWCFWSLCGVVLGISERGIPDLYSIKLTKVLWTKGRCCG